MSDLPSAQDSDAHIPKIDPPRNSSLFVVLGLLVIAIAFGGFGTWAAMAPLDSAVVAPGVVSVESRRKSVQHLEGGIIKEILVRDGQTVAAGQVLIRLDVTQTQANVTTIQNQLDAARALEARLLAERDHLDKVAFPEDMRARQSLPSVREVIEGQKTEFQERRKSLEGQTAILNKRVSQFEKEIEGLQAQQKSKQEQLRIIADELVGLRELHEKGYFPRTRILAMEREMARLRGERGEDLASIAGSENGIGEAELQIIQLEQRFREEVVNDLRETRDEIKQLQERLVVARDVLRRSEILSPLAGEVQELAVHTIGGVIGHGQELMQIVPTDDKLIVEAKVSPSDIDSLAEGQTAEVRLTSFQTRTTPIIQGTVSTVTADRIVDERNGVDYYLAQIVVPDDQLHHLEGKKLLAGMPAEALIKTGSRTVLEYLLKPIDDAIAVGLKEE